MKVKQTATTFTDDNDNNVNSNDNNRKKKNWRREWWITIILTCRWPENENNEKNNLRSSTLIYTHW